MANLSTVPITSEGAARRCPRRRRGPAVARPPKRQSLIRAHRKTNFFAGLHVAEGFLPSAPFGDSAPSARRTTGSAAAGTCSGHRSFARSSLEARRWLASRCSACDAPPSQMPMLKRVARRDLARFERMSPARRSGRPRAGTAGPSAAAACSASGRRCRRRPGRASDGRAARWRRRRGTPRSCRRPSGRRSDRRARGDGAARSTSSGSAARRNAIWNGRQLPLPGCGTGSGCGPTGRQTSSLPRSMGRSGSRERSCW